MKRVGEEVVIPSVRIADAKFLAPFETGLEYSVPARGTWTIVHVGMLVPEAHEIFVCAAGCLRGVVLSAAEMNLTDRFSTVAIEEKNVLEGDMEDLIIEGVTDILQRLSKLPKAVLIYSSCIHSFLGCDLEMCYDTLRERFPEVDFTDCYMIPTMRKSGLTPDQIMRRQLYSLIKPMKKEGKNCLIAGNCFSIDEDSDIVKLIKQAGWTLHQITDCKTYEEYLEIGKCSLVINTLPVSKAGAEALAKRLEMKHLYLPTSVNRKEIEKNLKTLAEALETTYVCDEEEWQNVLKALKKAHEVIKDTPIAIDYTFAPRILGIAKLLTEYGFNVTKIYTDSFNGEEKEEYLWLKKNAPDIKVYPTVHSSMREYPREDEGVTLALGQKAAFFCNTPYFVNIVENGGMYGFDGIKKLADMMIEAMSEKKDTEKLIGIKGLGCESCL